MKVSFIAVFKKKLPLLFCQFGKEELSHIKNCSMLSMHYEETTFGAASLLK